MALSSKDIVPLNKVRASLTALAKEARAGREKVITRNGEAFVALIDARQLDRYHQLEEEHGYLQLLEEAERGLDDVREGRTRSLAEVKKKFGRK